MIKTHVISVVTDSSLDSLQIDAKSCQSLLERLVL
jgi:hypothetical protein